MRHGGDEGVVGMITRRRTTKVYSRAALRKVCAIFEKAFEGLKLKLPEALGHLPS